MTTHVRPFDVLLTGSFLRTVLCGTVAGLVTAAVAGCAAKPVCSRDSDCGAGYLCIDNERCVLDPRADGGAPGVDAGVDATPGPDSNVQPSSCQSDTDVFDADEVYLLGSLSGVTCSPSAMAKLTDPDLESVGFPCNIDARSAVIRPADGRLLYLDTTAKKVFVFSKDDHPYDSGQGICRYPTNPTANDTEVATTSCNNSGGAADFRLAPDLEGVWYTCGNTPGLWFDENDAQLGFLDGSTPLVRGYGTSVLATRGSAAAATSDSLELFIGANEIPLGDLGQEGAVLAVRALDDGFRVVVQGDGESSGQLVNIALDGTITTAGTYPTLQAGLSIDATGVGSALDADGALYMAATETRQGQSHPAVVKLVLGSPETVVYAGASDPQVKAAGGTLVTGL